MKQFEEKKIFHISEHATLHPGVMFIDHGQVHLRVYHPLVICSQKSRLTYPLYTKDTKKSKYVSVFT